MINHKNRHSFREKYELVLCFDLDSYIIISVSSMIEYLSEWIIKLFEWIILDSQLKRTARVIVNIILASILNNKVLKFYKKYLPRQNLKGDSSRLSLNVLFTVICSGKHLFTQLQSLKSLSPSLQ